MKKLFISVPMKGRTEENIRKSMEKMHKMAEIIFDQQLEVIPTYIEHIPETKNTSVWCLGESIKKMAEADYFIGIQNYEEYFAGCMFETEVARRYGITSTHINGYEIMPDVREIIEEEWKKASCPVTPATGDVMAIDSRSEVEACND